MRILRGTALRAGDTIAVVAPASRVNPAALERGLAALRSLGLRPELGPSLWNGHGYLAGTDAERARDLQSAMVNPDIAAVICARGGYGAMRLLPLLDWDALCSNPKPLIGFSDITALHLGFWQQARLITFHGPMVEVRAEEAPTYNATCLGRALFHPQPLGQVPVPPEHAAALDTIVPGVARGRLLGGNLELVSRLTGTPWFPDMTGAVLLLEEVDEPPYRVDRMLIQLRLAGVLARVAGILFGYSPTCEQGPPDQPSFSLREVLVDILAPLGIPVLYGFPCGHGLYRTTLPLGVEVELDATQRTLTVLEPALEAAGAAGEGGTGA